MSEDFQEEITELKDELNKIKSKVEFDIEGDIDYVNRRIERLREDMNIWNRLLSISIPYTYERNLITYNSFLRKTRFPLFINEFRKLELQKNDMPWVITQKRLDNIKWRRNLVIRNTTYLKNAQRFHELGKNSSIDIKPILLYYSTTYLYSFFLHTFITYTKEKPHHGIYMDIKNDNINNIYIKFPKFGFFPKLVRMLSFLHYSSIFSDFIIDFERKKGKKVIIFSSNENIFSIGNKPFLLNDLINADPDQMYSSISLNYRLTNMSSRFIMTSNLLRNFILIFVSCSLARYHPTIWKETYEGETTNYFLPIQSSFEHINEIINLISNEFNRINDRREHGFQVTPKAFW